MTPTHDAWDVGELFHVNQELYCLSPSQSWDVYMVTQSTNSLPFNKTCTWWGWTSWCEWRHIQHIQDNHTWPYKYKTTPAIYIATQNTKLVVYSVYRSLATCLPTPSSFNWGQGQDGFSSWPGDADSFMCHMVHRNMKWTRNLHASCVMQDRALLPATPAASMCASTLFWKSAWIYSHTLWREVLL